MTDGLLRRLGTFDSENVASKRIADYISASNETSLRERLSELVAAKKLYVVPSSYRHSAGVESFVLEGRNYFLGYTGEIAGGKKREILNMTSTIDELFLNVALDEEVRPMVGKFITLN